ncbi:MAG: tyrosine-type recombinase/integrase [Candidatus Micrarchaeota archaeon]|nr:tyrosine-type recombinase/integrase [Candidatus Micrarchaeota archaeon]
MVTEEESRLMGFQRQLASSRMVEANRGYIGKYLKDALLRGLSPGRQKILLMEALYWEKLLKKDFKKATEDDLKDAVSRMQASKYRDATKKKKVAILKNFYRWLYDGDELPPQVKFAKRIHFKDVELDAKSIIRRDDLEKLLKACDNVRDSALLYLMWESGVRIGELTNAKLDDYKDEGAYYSLEVNGKTGRRKIVLVECVPYMKKWLNKHPFRAAANAPLFCSLVHKTMAPLSIRHTNTTLKALAGKANIKKPINPHAFRRAAASDKAPRYSHATICAYFGWRQGSRTPARYIGVDAEQTNAEVLKSYGIGKDTKPAPIAMVKCPNCGTENISGNLVCELCSRALNMGAALEVKKQLENVPSLQQQLEEMRKEQEETNRKMREEQERMKKEMEQMATPAALTTVSRGKRIREAQPLMKKTVGKARAAKPGDLA